MAMPLMNVVSESKIFDHQGKLLMKTLRLYLTS